MGGMILFGHDRERYFPDAWIQAGRFAGSDKSRILDRIEIHSFPVQAVEEAIAFVQKHSWHGATIGAVRRTDHWTLPPEAVREALINAVVHTDYSQRGAPIRLSISARRKSKRRVSARPKRLRQVHRASTPAPSDVE